MMDDSVSFAKSHKKKFIAKVVDGHVPAAKKTAIFMAGSPGAGKTEVATALEEMLSNICMIDADVFAVNFRNIMDRIQVNFRLERLCWLNIPWTMS